MVGLHFLFPSIGFLLIVQQMHLNRFVPLHAIPRITLFERVRIVCRTAAWPGAWFTLSTSTDPIGPVVFEVVAPSGPHVPPNPAARQRANKLGLLNPSRSDEISVINHTDQSIDLCKLISVSISAIDHED